LPADFKDWALADKDGLTVAHEAAKRDDLPGDFKGWALADKYGKTVELVHKARRIFRR
jgi:hypothetical protein